MVINYIINESDAIAINVVLEQPCVDVNEYILNNWNSSYHTHPKQHGQIQPIQQSIENLIPKLFNTTDIECQTN